MDRRGHGRVAGPAAGPVRGRPDSHATGGGRCPRGVRALGHGERRRRPTRPPPLGGARAYLDALGPVLAARPARGPALLLGDFNQMVPRVRAPLAHYEALLAATGSRFMIDTAGPIPGIGRQTVDHTFSTPDLRLVEVRGLPEFDDGGRRLNDQLGLTLVCRLASH